jgi:catechol 2,3-dioxygenase-like lactoylglutathione lyase family enzyme
MKITHVMLGTNDIDKARVFYDAVLSALGYAPTQHDPHRATYVAPDTPQFMIGAPYDGRPATFGNGVMTGFAAGFRGGGRRVLHCCHEQRWAL